MLFFFSQHKNASIGAISRCPCGTRHFPIKTFEAVTVRTETNSLHQSGTHRKFSVCQRTPKTGAQITVRAGVLEGAAARLELDRMPRKPCGARRSDSQREDFCAAWRHESNGILKPVKKSEGLF